MSEFPDDPGEMPGEGPPPPWRSAGSDLDLTEAALTAGCAAVYGDEASQMAARQAVYAAAPLIERQVRERIVGDIRDMPSRYGDSTAAQRLGYEWGRADAIYIARGGAA